MPLVQVQPWAIHELEVVLQVAHVAIRPHHQIHQVRIVALEALDCREERRGRTDTHSSNDQ